MELIIEILMELIFEGTFELSKNKKVPKFLRYPLIALIILLFIAVLTILLYTTYLAFKEKWFIVGSILLIISIYFLTSGIKKLKKDYLNQKNKKES